MARVFTFLQSLQRKHPLNPAYLFPSPLFQSRQLFSSSFHQDLFLFDQMPQTASFEFKLHNLLKTQPDDPFLVASIHSLSIKANILLNTVFRTSLLTSYARVSDLISSLSLFDEDVSPDVISWNAIINACLMNHDLQASVDLFKAMVSVLQEFDSTTLVTVLSAAARTCNLKQGTVLHGTILKRNFISEVQLCNALMNMYAKCGDLPSSELMFKDMGANKDAASWNVMINGSLHNGFPEKSAFYFNGMTRSSVRPDRVSLSSAISACSCSNEFHSLGEAVHGWLIKLCHRGMHGSSIENSLISFYSHHGDVEAAKEVFHTLVDKNIVSWNSMICGLVENHGIDEALQLFRELLKMAPSPNELTLIAILPACRKLDLLCLGKSIHAFAIRNQMEISNPPIANCLLDMYINCKDFVSAGLLFRTMLIKDLVSWNTMISGYSKNNFTSRDARALFFELLQRDARCSLATLLGVLSSCVHPQDLSYGKSLHSWGLKCGFAADVPAANALMLMYIRCGDMFASCLLFRSILPAIDIVSLNTIIAGFAHHGLHKDLMETFHWMRHFSDLQPDPITYVSVLSACGNLRLIRLGRSVHALIVKSSAVLDLMARNVLITMYFRCGEARCSEAVFLADKDRNLCSWNCMISGSAQNKNGWSALEYFKRMGSCRANEFSLVGVLCACSQLGNLSHGREVHGYATKSGLLANLFISSALLDMYSKCGRLDVSIRVFESSPEKSIASWNSMISAFGFHGHGELAISTFAAMSRSGIRPTRSTFIALLSACSHCGLVDEGCRHYRLMKEGFGLVPGTEHDVCLADMLGRAGRIREAHDLVQKSSSAAEPGTWGAILSSCADHADLEMGRSAAEHLFSLEPDNIGYYVTLSNLYACHGMWSKAEEVRSLVHGRGLMKPSGLSLVCL